MNAELIKFIIIFVMVILPFAIILFAIASRFNSLDEKIKESENRINKLDKEIKELKRRINSLEEEIQELKKED